MENSSLKSLLVRPMLAFDVLRPQFFSMSKTPANFPFISDEASVGDPPYSLEDFQQPKLRRFPEPPSSLQWNRFLGAGEDGFVLSATRTDGSLVAVKFFYHSTCPGPIAPNLRRYWAFKRECLNGALLSMIKASIKQAEESGRPIYVNSEPKTRKDAIENLEAFAAERCTDEEPRRADWKALNYRPLINDCFGWTEMSLGDTHAALKRVSVERGQFSISRAYVDMDGNDRRFAIVYPFVLEDALQVSVVQEQLDFFHLVGFVLAPFRDENWKGKGVLVDLSDLLTPQSQSWRVGKYRRMEVGEHFAELQKWKEETAARVKKIRDRVKPHRP